MTVERTGHERDREEARGREIPVQVGELQLREEDRCRRGREAGMGSRDGDSDCWVRDVHANATNDDDEPADRRRTSLPTDLHAAAVRDHPIFDARNVSEDAVIVHLISELRGAASK